MKTETLEFAVTKKGNVIEKIGRSSLPKPKTSFSGGSIKWYQDKPRKESK